MTETEHVQLLDVAQVANRLDLGVSTVRRWIAEGAIPVVRLGRRVLVEEAALAEIVAAARAGSAQEGAHEEN